MTWTSAAKSSVFALGAIAAGMFASCSSEQGARVDPGPLVGAMQLASRDPEISALLAARSGEWERRAEAIVSPTRNAGGSRMIAARLPTRADGLFEIGVGRAEHLGLRVTHPGIRAVEPELGPGVVAYRDAYASTDIVAFATPERFEELLFLRDPSAPSSVAWRIELPFGVDGAQLSPYGGLDLVDAAGATVLRVPRPFAIDARGQRREADVAWDGSELVVTLDRRDLAFPILLDPAVEVAVWTQIFKAAPPPRFSHGMAYDANRAVTVLFGGKGIGSVDLGDTWEWNMTGWVQRMPATSPSARTGPALAYDTARNVTVLFGGDTFGDETWEWDGTVWAKRAPATNPSARMLSALAYDSARAVTVLFGGLAAGAAQGDTWEWDGTSWTPRMPPTNPPARSLHGLAYDSARHVTVMSGGVDTNGQFVNDTWEYDGIDWTQRAIGTTPNATNTIAYDSARAKVLMILGGGGFHDFEWDGTAWTEILPFFPATSRNKAAVAYDASQRDVVLFGGMKMMTIFGDTWLFDVRGGGCSGDADCDTGHCVDGTCCTTASCGTCQACNTPASPGICATVMNAPDPDTCNGGKTCNAAGACVEKNGQSCALPADCLSGFCVAGMCCDSACDGACQACSAATKQSGIADGTCDIAADGTNPNDVCPTDAVTGCQHDGKCSGGACELYIAGTACGVGNVCNGNSAAGQLCDGLGSCNASAGIACAPGLCKSGSCITACASNADCDANGYCDGVVCKTKQSQGTACTKDDACVSAHCVDGFCCGGVCTGECEACDVKGSEGTCAPVSGAPHAGRAACPETPGEPCSATECDGKTRTLCARFAGAMVVCGEVDCTNGTATFAGVCGGAGQCKTPPKVPCGAFACKGTACATSCTTIEDCAAGNACSAAGKCVSAATCDGDHKVTGADGKTVDCSPFKCEGNGSCKVSCTSVDDCVAPSVCDATGKCVAPAPAAQSGDSGGCSLASPSPSGECGLIWLALFVPMLRRRRRRPELRR